jgi:hypothetical protein
MSFVTSPVVSDLRELLRHMQPVLNQGVYVYTCVPFDHDLSRLQVLASIREQEGLTLVMEEPQALMAGLPILFRAAWISLHVHSDLQAVGLTAAFANALGAVGISCNVIAGAHHDHIFVPLEKAKAAMQALQDLQAHASQQA